eukprot:gene10150-1833_t
MSVRTEEGSPWVCQARPLYSHAHRALGPFGQSTSCPRSDRLQVYLKHPAALCRAAYTDGNGIPLYSPLSAGLELFETVAAAARTIASWFLLDHAPTVYGDGANNNHHSPCCTPHFCRIVRTAWCPLAIDAIRSAQTGATYKPATGPPRNGTLYLTDYHVCWIASESSEYPADKQQAGPTPSQTPVSHLDSAFYPSDATPSLTSLLARPQTHAHPPLCVPLTLILRCEVTSNSASGGGMSTLVFQYMGAPSHRTLALLLKDGNAYQFTTDPLDKRVDAFLTALRRQAEPVAIGNFPKKNVSAQWGKKFDPHTEFARLGCLGESSAGGWKLCEENANYQLCSSYPALLCVPAGLEAHLIKSAAFRSKGRFPCVTWHCEKTGRVICRSAQPHTGPLGARCPEDENLVNAVCKAAGQTPLCIFDCRPWSSAQANKYLRGAGVENENHYDNCRVEYGNMDNMHAVRGALLKLQSAVRQGVGPVDLLLHSDTAPWHKHVHSLLEAAEKATCLFVDEGCNLLVHCTDGWDRTPQICTLVQLMLDPYYRTIEGFQVLIDKDWLAFGHKFAHRCGNDLQFQVPVEGEEWIRGSPPISTDEISPTFLQWLCCVHQLIQSRPTVFEFSALLLDFLAEHHLSGCFGTFLMNTEQERLSSGLLTKAPSLWLYISEHAEAFRNHLYRPNPLPLRALTPAPTLSMWVLHRSAVGEKE